jgi:6-phosphogluconate dehydrogenase
MTDPAVIGVTGLATMGQNLARNLARHGFTVAVHNRHRERTDHLMKDFGHEGSFVPAYSAKELVSAIGRPRAVLMMVQAGAPVDAVIQELLPFLEPGDILVDGGNSLFTDTQRRCKELESRGLRYIGTGVSGGEEGALNGPSIMPGGSRDAYDIVAPMLTTIAAQVDGEPCCTFIGPDGAGHYVKMVHNGIEYADMQLIAEAYDLLRTAFGLEAPQIAEVFSGWKTGDLDSYLIEITAEVLGKTDEATGRPMVDMVLDEAEQKGTGRWTVHSALDLGVPITGIAEAVFARVLSSQKEKRGHASRVLERDKKQTPIEPSQSNLNAVRNALYASKIVAYAQGFQQMLVASQEYGWHIDLGAVSRIWRGGCIIRARFLDRIMEAYKADPGLSDLLLTPYFADGVLAAEDDWRRVVTMATQHAVPTPAFSSSLTYFDGLRRERGTGNLIQALRDYFGAHTYRRVDRPGTFHTRWGQDGREIEVGGTY